MPLLIQEAEAGIISTITSHFFRDYNERLMKSFTESMKGMEAQKYCSANAIGELFTTHLCIGQQTIANYNVRETSSRLWLDPEANQLRLRVSGISLEFAFDFKVWSDPEWIRDYGTGTV